jgi:hypothetical protein
VSAGRAGGDSQFEPPPDAPFRLQGLAAFTSRSVVQIFAKILRQNVIAKRLQ